MREWMKLVESTYEPANDGRPAEVADAEADEIASAKYDRERVVEDFIAEFLDHDASIEYDSLSYDEDDNRQATIKTAEPITLNQLELLKQLGGDVVVSSRFDGRDGLSITLIVKENLGQQTG
jgi:hypothetical protein